MPCTSQDEVPERKEVSHRQSPYSNALSTATELRVPRACSQTNDTFRPLAIRTGPIPADDEEWATTPPISL